MQQLREINFGDCLLKTRGATLLSEVLSDEHEALEILNLTNNEIGPNGGLSLASAMANKINLQSLLLDGNQFGQECREMIMEELRLFNLEHTLGSLEEDDSEGEEEYDEGEDEMEEEEIDTEDLEYIEDDDECAEDDEETDDAVEDAEQEIMPNRNVLRSEVTPVEAFCRAEQPTLAMFEEIDAKDRTAAFRNYLNGLPGEFYLVYLVFAILKCSALSLQSKEALAVSDDLFADALKYAQDKSQVNSVRNFFLIQLCLLRCEDKSFKPTYDPKACRISKSTH
uniref:Ran-GTPase activating protein 1 C-terminal domain-containing protein n=1 Tax=Phlebotomus papatasi TaxID=29031 RepID=A0A1B0DIE2_PHLPP